MKRILLIYVCALFTFICVNAQNYDEADLVGTWTRTQAMSPVDQYLQSVDRITLGQGVFNITEQDGTTYPFYGNGVFEGKWQGKSDGEDMDWYNDVKITNFAITNGNKLHIHIIDDFNLIFKIVKLTSTELVLQPLGSNNDIYLTKSNNTGVNSAKVAQSTAKETFYNLEGQQLDKAGEGINIIKPSNGKAYKVINK